MNYFKDVFTYFGKNILYMLVFAVVPAVFCGLLLQPFALFEFLAEYPNSTIHNFGEFFLAVFHLEWLDILWIILAFIFLALAVSLLLGFLESHFKTGKHNLVNSFSLNSNILTVCKILLLLTVVVFVINLILMLLMFLVHVIFNNNASATTASVIINYILVIAGMFPLARVLTLFTQTCIEMLINGSPMNVSFSDSTHSVARNGPAIFAVEATLFLVIFAVIIGFAYLDLNWLGNIIGMLLFVPIECILGMCVFFSTNGIRRYDIRKTYVY